MVDNTVFDSVFKTMLSKEPQLFVPFINEAFGRSYPLDEPVLPFSTDFETVGGERFADSVFRLADKIYHVECQSTHDADMVVRMIEYDFAVALSETIRTGKPYEMRFPESCVLYLRSSSCAPHALTMRVHVSEGQSFKYKVKVVNAQSYSSKEIFEKHLLLLLPYYLMRYEKELSQIADDDNRITALVAECADLRAELEAMTVATGNLVLYDSLIELIMRVSDHLLSAHEVLRKRVRSTMGGEVLELWHDRFERMQRENDEMRAANDEMRAANDEMRAANDEMRAANEEMRAANEEMRAEAAAAKRDAKRRTAEDIAASLRSSGVDESIIQQALAVALAEG